MLQNLLVRLRLRSPQPATARDPDLVSIEKELLAIPRGYGQLVRGVPVYRQYQAIFQPDGRGMTDTFWLNQGIAEPKTGRSAAGMAVYLKANADVLSLPWSKVEEKPESAQPGIGTLNISFKTEGYEDAIRNLKELDTLVSNLGRMAWPDDRKPLINGKVPANVDEWAMFLATDEGKKFAAEEVARASEKPGYVAWPGCVPSLWKDEMESK